MSLDSLERVQSRAGNSHQHPKGSKRHMLDLSHFRVLLCNSILVVAHPSATDQSEMGVEHFIPGSKEQYGKTVSHAVVIQKDNLHLDLRHGGAQATKGHSRVFLWHMSVWSCPEIKIDQVQQPSHS